jgi:hypothetical protein
MSSNRVPLGTASIALIDRDKSAKNEKSKKFQWWRGPAMSASLGLYAGLIFGAYLASSKYLYDKRENFPINNSSDYYPESSESTYDSPFSNPFSSGYEAPQYWDPTFGRNNLPVRSNKRIKNNYYFSTPLIFMTF